MGSSRGKILLNDTLTYVGGYPVTFNPDNSGDLEYDLIPMIPTFLRVLTMQQVVYTFFDGIMNRRGIIISLHNTTRNFPGEDSNLRLVTRQSHVLTTELPESVGAQGIEGS